VEAVLDLLRLGLDLFLDGAPVNFQERERYLRLGEACGEVDRLAVQREMIRRTIKEHLDKEKRLRPQGIKVLSLFFIDEVARYRQYDADGNSVKGEYAHIFEEEYKRLANHPDYRTLFEEVDLSRAAEEVHDGYFSIDKKSKRAVDTTESNQGGREAAEQAHRERWQAIDNPPEE
jgi:type III restriction enzyme